jgi:hypothetical protein
MPQHLFCKRAADIGMYIKEFAPVRDKQASLVGPAADRVLESQLADTRAAQTDRARCRLVSCAAQQNWGTAPTMPNAAASS